MKNLSLVLFIVAAFLLTCCHPGPPQEAKEVKTEPDHSSSWTEADRQFLLAELDRSTEELLKEVEDLSPDQWNFKENPYRWDISEIVEHLTIQNELQYRELYAASSFPALPDYALITRGKDDFFQSYATDPQKSQAKWFLQPIGRFGFKRAAIDAFLRARDGIHDFVEATDVDLRTHFTFRENAGDKPLDEVTPGEVRDLHQLVLTGIAHTDRHIRQIRNIKKDRMYPRNI